MYNATIVKLPKPIKHPNADRLLIFHILGYQVITDDKPKEGDIGIFFPDDGQVSEEFAKHNNLVKRKDPITGDNVGGYMDENRRVRAINLRGEKSYGMWLPLTSLSFLSPIPELNVGDELNAINGHEFCTKYYTTKTRNVISKNKKKTNRKETPTFKRHIDTKKLQQQIGHVYPGGFFVITEKVHGTSGRFGSAYEQILKPWYDPTRYFVDKYTREWVELTGTRNVILRTDSDVESGFYNSNEFRLKSVEPLRGKLHKGETIYYEIVGWVDERTPIMPTVSTKILKDKSFVEEYGEQMTYKYGCIPGTCKLLVYRITMSNEDGTTYDLPWLNVKRRCEELGVEYVNELIPMSKLDVEYIGLEQANFENMHETEYIRQALLEISDQNSKGPSTYDHSHMKEGVVIRIERGLPVPDLFKYKSHEFLIMEGHTKDREDYIDLEEVS